MCGQTFGMTEKRIRYRNRKLWGRRQKSLKHCAKNPRTGSYGENQEPLLVMEGEDLRKEYCRRNREMKKVQAFIPRERWEKLSLS